MEVPGYEATQGERVKKEIANQVGFQILKEEMNIHHLNIPIYTTVSKPLVILGARLG